MGQPKKLQRHKIKPEALARQQDTATPIDHLPNGKAALLSVTRRSSSFSGPIPPPSMLKEYDEVLPGMADRILKMAENQSSHRLQIEHKVVIGEITRAQLGMRCAFFIAVLGLVLGTILAATGYVATGSSFAGVPLATIVIAFLYSTNQKRKERAEKARIMTGAKELTP